LITKIFILPPKSSRFVSVPLPAKSHYEPFVMSLYCAVKAGKFLSDYARKETLII